MPILEAKRIGRLVLGGAFNPIHMGHLITARAAAEEAGAERVVLMVAGHSPNKQSDELASSAHRLRMCQLATQNDPLFAVDDRELGRAGPSYTIDTVTELTAAGWDDFAWLIGADQLNALHTWKHYEALLSSVPFVIMCRPGYPLAWDQLPSHLHALQGAVVAVPQVDIASSQIRQRIRNGKRVEYLTPDSVCEYIREHHLYGPPGAGI